MKENDVAKVVAEVTTQIEQTEWSVLDYITKEKAILAVSWIYMMADLTTGYGQDFLPDLSIISSPKRISVIHGRYSSMYDNGEDIVWYDDLAMDINQILICLQAAIERMEYNMNG